MKWRPSAFHRLRRAVGLERRLRWTSSSLRVPAKDAVTFAFVGPLSCEESDSYKLSPVGLGAGWRTTCISLKTLVAGLRSCLEPATNPWRLGKRLYRAAPPNRHPSVLRKTERLARVAPGECNREQAEVGLLFWFCWRPLRNTGASGACAPPISCPQASIAQSSARSWNWLPHGGLNCGTNGLC